MNRHHQRHDLSQMPGNAAGDLTKDAPGCSALNAPRSMDAPALSSTPPAVRLMRTAGGDNGNRAIIEDFIDQYVRELGAFREVAQIGAKKAEQILEENGIRAIVSSRVKRPDRLRQKIEKRHRLENYESLEEISADIADLAGVRIALYFPHTHKRVDQLVRTHFDCLDVKRLPEHKHRTGAESCHRFRGYQATHYRVRLRPDTLPAQQARYATAQIEIQLASVLMLAWAEVEHDLRYKEFQGAISEREHLILDELAGIVLAGEHALARLDKITADRTSTDDITNHYELTAFILEEFHRTHPVETKPVVMGRADILFQFLQSSGMEPESLDPLIGDLDPDLPMIPQLVDAIVAGKPERYWLFLQAKRQIEGRKACGCIQPAPQSEPEQQAIRYFVLRWAALERLVERPGHDGPPHLWATDGPEEVRERLLAEFHRGGRLVQARELRHGLLRDPRWPAQEALLAAGQQIETALNELGVAVAPDKGDEIEDGSRRSRDWTDETGLGGDPVRTHLLTTIPVLDGHPGPGCHGA